MTDLETIKKALDGVSSAFNRVLAEAPAESDHYSIGFDCTRNAIRINLQDMRTISELIYTLESLQRENEELIARSNEAVEAANALQVRTDTAEAEVKRLREALGAVLAAHDIKSVKGKLLEDVIASATERARTALASTGGEHHAE